MRTKEIEVYVQDKILDGKLCQIIGLDKAHESIRFSVPDKSMTNYFCGETALKARLIIELPEKKIEITESEFDEAASFAFGDAIYFCSLKTLKKKLFGEGREG